MAIVRWEPFRELSRIQRELDRLFPRRFFGEAKDEFFAEGAWAPNIDVYETANEVIVNADVPGLDQKEIKIRVEDNTLTIEGEKKVSSEVKEEDYLSIERRYGKFKRVIPLSSSIDRDKISASFDKGVLEIKMNKKEELKPKEITVEVKEKK